jgi:hypothetical protein
MNVSGWLPVSYSVYMTFERRVGEECYNIAKYVADSLNDNPKITNKQFIKSFAKHLMLDDKRLIENESEYMYHINFLIDFIRDSFMIYQQIMKEE